MPLREGAASGRSPAALLLGLAAILSAIVTGLDVMPALSERWGAVARAALSPTCHQWVERSFAIGGHPLAACARCVGLHASGLAAMLVLLPARSFVASHRGTLAVIASAAWALLALDVAGGMALPAWDHPWIRFATGLLAGASVLAWGAASISASACESAGTPSEAAA